MAIIDGKIRCSDCKTFRPTVEFIPSVVKIGCGQCRQCKYARKRAYEQANPEKRNAARKKVRDAKPEQHRATVKKWRDRNPDKVAGYELKKNYGITLEEYNVILTRQGGKCACCGRDQNTCGRKLFVDHCHETGRIRGIICNRCNYGIGALGDNIEGVQRALEYLKG